MQQVAGVGPGFSMDFSNIMYVHKYVSDSLTYFAEKHSITCIHYIFIIYVLYPHIQYIK